MNTGDWNQLGQPVGFALPQWRPRDRPPKNPMIGRYCRIEPLTIERHASPLFAAMQQDSEGRNWTYLGYGPFVSLDEYRAWLSAECLGDDPLFFAIVEPDSGMAVGLASYLRIDADHGVMEVGHIHFSPQLQRTRAATEAMFLMMRRAFDELGYRRLEWKCDALNDPSRRAAHRLGFQLEGVFRQASIYKGRNRDTAWHAILDQDWPEVKALLERWLAPENFRSNGEQIVGLRPATWRDGL